MATESGFVRDTFEKVLRLKEILKFLNEDKFLREHLLLKGGTAINLTVFNLPRLSVDIDVDYTPNDTREDMLECRVKITDIIKEYMESERYQLSEASRFSHSLDAFHYNYQNAGENVRIDEETGEEVSTVENRVAVLQKTETGKYRVMDVINEAKDAARKEAYKAALENLYVNHVFPDGTTCNYFDAQDLEKSQFTILDIDGDGEEELIIRYVSGPMGGMREVIYGFSGGDFLMEEFLEFPPLVYYDNGFIRADASHNQGDDTDGWPYVMYKYMGESDSYKEVGSGVSGDGSIESYVGTGKEMDVPFLHLTEENIQSIQ